MHGVKMVCQGLGQCAFAGGFAAKQAHPAHKGGVNYRRKPLPVCMHVCSNHSARDWYLCPVAIHQNMLDRWRGGVLFTEESSEFFGKTAAVILARKNGIDTHPKRFTA